MSLTQGMGEHWGSYLVSYQFRLKFLRRIIKKIIEVVKRFIPWLRRKVKVRVKVVGSPSIPVFFQTLLQGYPAVSVSKVIPIKGDFISLFSSKVLVKSDIVFPTQMKLVVSGNPVSSSTALVKVRGDLSVREQKEVTLTGKKDFSLFLMEILDEE